MAQSSTTDFPARRTSISFAPDTNLPPDEDVVPLRELDKLGGTIHRVGTSSSERSRTRVGKFWSKWVKITVPQKYCRDHFALERTVLAYLRTSQAFAMLGVTSAQFMRLNNDGDPDHTFGFFKVSVPLASSCMVMSIVIVLAGVVRFFRWQATMAYGYSLSSGWDFLLIIFFSLAILLTFFILHVAISVERSR